MCDIYNGADLFVLPTEFEPWGLVGTEALATGKPILMTAVGGVPRYLKDGINGYFIKPHPEDIANKIQLLSDNRELYLSLGDMARKSALEYSWGNIARQYLSLIEEVSKEKR